MSGFAKTPRETPRHNSTKNFFANGHNNEPPAPLLDIRVPCPSYTEAIHKQTTHAKDKDQIGPFLAPPTALNARRAVATPTNTWPHILEPWPGVASRCRAPVSHPSVALKHVPASRPLAVSPTHEAHVD